jgi:very-short-patch-repair endonuclease
LKVGIEFDGGVWGRGGHSRGLGSANDREKDREAQILGWNVFRYVTINNQVNTQRVVDDIQRLVEARSLRRVSHEAR